MNLIPGLSLRAAEEGEILGIDETEIGEFAYDYVERERDYIHMNGGIEGVVPLRDVGEEKRNIGKLV